MAHLFRDRRLGVSGLLLIVVDNVKIRVVLQKLPKRPLIGAGDMSSYQRIQFGIRNALRLRLCFF